MSAAQTKALSALQAALTALFKSDAALMVRLAGRIHDGTPKAFVLPYLAFAEMRGRDFSAGETLGARVLLTIEAISAEEGRQDALAILDRAVDLALAAPLALDHGTLVLLRLNDSGVVRLKDGRGWRAFARFEALIDG